MQAILAAVQAARMQAVVVYPNSDRGHSGIVEAIQKASAPGRTAIRVARNLHGDEFLRALMAARVLVGNSSCGVIEAASAGTPAVNVGSRQDGRQRSGTSVGDCGEGAGAIRQAITRALARRVRPLTRSVYGDGTAGRQIARILAQLKITPEALRKQITY
jgi:UDP-N-acetylglucosamine 2-epimerase